MNSILKLCFGRVASYNIDSRLYSVSTEDGRILNNVRKVGDLTTNSGARKVGELEPGVSVILLLKYIDPDVDIPEGFILGGYEAYCGKKLGSNIEKQPQLKGAQGFIDRMNRCILLNPDGSIDIKAGAMCEMHLNPEDREFMAAFQNNSWYQNVSNYLRWIIHHDSVDDEGADSVFQLCLSGKEATFKDIPDIEILAGALYNLDPDEFFHNDEMPDPGAKLAIRITDPDSSIPSNTIIQAGSMDKGVALSLKTVKDKAEIDAKIGSMNDGGVLRANIKQGSNVDTSIVIGNLAKNLISNIQVNKLNIRVYSDGRCVIKNDKIEVEGLANGTLNIVCEKSNLGEKNASNHLAIAEQVISLMDDLINAIMKATWMATAPGSPTAPSGPINIPEFIAVKTQLDTIKSLYHTING
ncbi:MAG: hypothetical protein WCY30_00195 [Candidatus Neomarinimicrobiota bacterium]|jgi:hypothetical protein